MEAQAWTAIGLLAATLVGAFFYLGNRIDALGSEMRNQFHAQGARIDAMSPRMDGLIDRMYGLEAKVDDHLRRHAG